MLERDVDGERAETTELETKEPRFGAIGAIALAGAFALSSCAANEGGTGGDERVAGADIGLPEIDPRGDHHLD